MLMLMTKITIMLIKYKELIVLRSDFFFSRIPSRRSPLIVCPPQYGFQVSQWRIAFADIGGATMLARLLSCRVRDI